MATKSAPHHFRRTMTGFAPVSAAARDFYGSTKLDQIVELKVRRPRNPGHHRKLFALLGLVADNCEQFAGPYDVLVAVKAALGRGRWLKLDGASREIFMPDSISFSAMSQADFEPFYEAAIAAVLRWWMPVGDEALRAAIAEFAA
jgi:hypothetical protein